MQTMNACMDDQLFALPSVNEYMHYGFGNLKGLMIIFIDITSQYITHVYKLSFHRTT